MSLDPQMHMAGGFVYGLSDLQFHLVGYLLILINIASHSGFSLYIKWLDSTRHYSVYTMSLYTNGMGIVFLLGLAFIAGDLPNNSITGLGQMSSSSVAILLCSGVAGWAISTAGFWANTLFSATAWTVQGALNKIPTLVLSVILFGTKLSAGMIAGTVITSIGGLAFPLTVIQLDKKKGPAYSKLKDEEPSTPTEKAGSARSV